MATRGPFSVDEWYHCFNRGVDKRRVFENKRDYERFLMGVHLGNSSLTVHISNLTRSQSHFPAILATRDIQRGEPLVEIGAYSLMPNHYHFLIKEIREGGIALFMQKIMTSYTMYFNKKRERTGPLFAGAFKSRHVADDVYINHLISYIHLNPVELHEPRWKEGIGNIRTIETFLNRYEYSSLPSFLNAKRAERALLGNSVFELFDSVPPIKRMLSDAQEYYQENQDFIKVAP